MAVPLGLPGVAPRCEGHDEMDPGMMGMLGGGMDMAANETFGSLTGEAQAAEKNARDLQSRLLMVEQANVEHFQKLHAGGHHVRQLAWNAEVTRNLLQEECQNLNLYAFTNDNNSSF